MRQEIEELVAKFEACRIQNRDAVAECCRKCFVFWCLYVFVVGMPNKLGAEERLSLLVESMQTSNIKLDLMILYHILCILMIFDFIMIIAYYSLVCWICRSMSQLIQALGLVQQIPCSSRARFANECRRGKGAGRKVANKSSLNILFL